jgi:hypothetical protein
MTDWCASLWIIVVVVLLVALCGVVAARAQPAQQEPDPPVCGARADMERGLREQGYTTRAAGQDSRGNAVAWMQNAAGEWAVTITLRGRDLLCIAGGGTASGK